MNADGVTAIRQREEHEEEALTAYRRAELSENWEFKILRSVSGAFGKSEVLRRALEDEGLSGWVLVEKFDDFRLRFKRLRNGTDDGLNPNIDPYRTFYGSGHFGRRVTWLACAVCAVAVLATTLLLAG